MQSDSRGPLLAAFLLILGTLLPSALSGAALPAGQTQALTGTIINTDGAAIPGVVCTLMGGILPDQGVTATSSAHGAFSFRGLLPGTYVLTCTALGYVPFVKTGLVITDTLPPELAITMPAAKKMVEKVEVHAGAGTVSQQLAAPPSTLGSGEIATLPLVEQKFKAALPLTPGVVRTPDGKINIRGSVENQGMLLIDSAEAVSPITGSYDIDLSIDAIQSLNVYKAPFDPQFGGFSGGLTTIDTKAPSPAWTWDLNDFFPSFRGRSGHLVGVNEWEPRFDFTAPVWKQLSVSESFIYDMLKIPVRGLAWPHNETKREGWNSYTDFQYVASPRHVVSFDIHLFPHKHEFANIDTLIPQPASSNLSQRGFSLQGNDSYQFNSGGILTTIVKFTRFDENAHGQGPLNMLLTPNGLGGNWFNAYNRNSHQEEASAVYRFANHKWKGTHQFKAGTDLIYRAYDGTSASNPVDLLRLDNSLAEEIQFFTPTGIPSPASPSALAASNTEGAAFVGDHWMLTDRAALDLGLRYFGQSVGNPAALAPRLGFVFSPDRKGNTILRGGAGVFESRVPLLAGDFDLDPLRAITLFDQAGAPLGPTTFYPNLCQNRLDDGQFVIAPTCHDLNATPYNITWTGEFDHQFGPRIAFRASYLHSNTYKEFMVNPVQPSPISAALLLSNLGASRYHEFEATTSYRAPDGNEVNFSYIHSQSRGDLNTISNILVPFKAPVIRPDFYSALDSDVPNRLITWGVLHLPWRIVFAPIVDWRSGFPYSPVDDLQNYALRVAKPNTLRFPNFFSFDFKVWHTFQVPSFMPFGLSRAKLRIGVGVRNATDALDPRDVYNNVASPIFGHFAGFQHRVIEINADTGP